MSCRTPAGTQKAGPPAGRRRRVLMGVLGALGVCVLLCLLLPRWLAWGARQRAVRALERGAISSAQRWLARARALTPKDPRVRVLEAACFRHLRQVRPFVRALDTAEKEGAPLEMIAKERTLGLIQAGRFDQAGDRQPAELIAAGFSPHDVAGALVCGLLARGQATEARKTLDAWATDFPDHAQVAYMEGIYWHWLGNTSTAEEQFRKALERDRRHELARMALAELLEQEDRVAEALEQFARWADDFPYSELARAGLARLLRSIGRPDEARQVVEGASTGQVGPILALEIAQIELELGQLSAARQWLDQVDYSAIEEREALRAAATAFGLTDQPDQAKALFARADEAYRRMRRIGDLRARLAVDPGHRAASDELGRLIGQSQLQASSVPAGRALEDRQGAREPLTGSVSGLYTRWCAPCHGAEGRGDGPAARHLFPPPRDFYSESFRLVSTTNAVPTREDVEVAIRRGMPGTAMRAFDNLTDAERKQLAEEVLGWYRQGIHEQLLSALAAQHEEVDAEELEQAVTLRVTPGPAIEVPAIGPTDPAIVARGKQIYLALGCAKCHGDDGRGTGDVPLVDEKGNPCIPRDLVSDPFKGGNDPEAIFLRIRVGMPGTPHPACLQVASEQIVAVVHYCRAIAQTPKRVLTNHQRWSEAAAWRRLDSSASQGAGNTASGYRRPGVQATPTEAGAR